MTRGDRLYTAYCRILEQDLLPATGCTEPIALALCAAKARRALGALPEKIVIEVSGNILKNAKCVTVPNTNGMKGIEAAVCAGVVAGREERALDVQAGLTETQIGQITAYHARTPIRLALLDASELLDMIVTVFAGEHRACVRLNKHHTHIHSIFRDDQCLYLDKTEDGAATTWWWLRSPGNNRRNAAHVDYDGSLIPRSVSVDRGCVRPALWVNLDADFFQSLGSFGQ